MSVNNNYSCTAISLKTHDFGEADKIFVLFSREFGVLRAVAKGIKKTNSKFGGRLDLLNVNSLVIRRGKNIGTIIQCDNHKIFPKLRTDYDKLIYSLYTGELILLFANEGEAMEASFDLLLETLEKIQETENPLIEVICFEMQFLKILGYQANLNSCDLCHENVPYTNDRLALSLNTGGIICSKCMKFSDNYRIITDEMRVFLKKSELSHLEIEFTPAPEVLEKLHNIIKEYMTHLSERKIKTLAVFEK